MWTAVSLLALVCSGHVLAQEPVKSCGKSSKGKQAKFATFNASLNRNKEGELTQDLTFRNDSQAKEVATVIQLERPQVLLTNEFDYVPDYANVKLFHANYLAVPQVKGAQGITYKWTYTGPVNTGVPSPVDVNKDGKLEPPTDAYGFGAFPGQYGMVVWSNFPIIYSEIRTFQKFLWKDMPGRKIPLDPATGKPWFNETDYQSFRLSSKSHWDIPILINGQKVHFLVSHPTPPVFGIWNAPRNYDEIRFWTDYIGCGVDPSYIYDDNGNKGGLAPGSYFVLAGDQNADPKDGDAEPGAINQWTDTCDKINTSVTPEGPGGLEAYGNVTGPGLKYQTPAATKTTGFGLRVDYVLPSKNLPIVNSGIFWPNSPTSGRRRRTHKCAHRTESVTVNFAAQSSPLAYLNDASDHHSVWVTVCVPRATPKIGRRLMLMSAWV